MSGLYKRLCGVCVRQAAFPHRCKSGAAVCVWVQPESLRGNPHRQHPGITNLSTLRLPRPLQTGALTLIHGAELNDLAERARGLSHFLWSRKRAVETAALREKAVALERKWAESERGQRRDEDEVSFEARIRSKVLAELKRTTYHWTPLKYDADLGVVYMAARLAGGYAAVMRALHEIKKRDSAFAPRSLLDFGSGLGTVLWASHELWSDSLKEFVCVDASGAMNTLAERLLTEGGGVEAPHIRQVYFRQFLPVSPRVRSDLVTAAFSLSELSSQKERTDAVTTLWRKTHGYLVLVENGTKEGHQILMEARDVLLQREDQVTHDEQMPQIFAPCTHQLPCPKLQKEPMLPCNFMQAHYPLPTPGGCDPVQERFSYLVLTRTRERDPEGRGQWGRLISAVQRRTRHARCHVCCSSGELRLAVTARHHGRDSYRCARSSDWGDRLPLLHTEPDPRTDG